MFTESGLVDLTLTEEEMKILEEEVRRDFPRMRKREITPGVDWKEVVAIASGCARTAARQQWPESEFLSCNGWDAVRDGLWRKNLREFRELFCWDGHPVWGLVEELIQN